MLLTVVCIGMAIASFYFAYVLIIFLVMLVVGGISYLAFSREETIDWFNFEE